MASVFKRCQNQMKTPRVFHIKARGWSARRPTLGHEATQNVYAEGVTHKIRRMYNAFSVNEPVGSTLPSVRRCASTLGCGVKRRRRRNADIVPESFLGRSQSNMRRRHTNGEIRLELLQQRVRGNFQSRRGQLARLSVLQGLRG